MSLQWKAKRHKDKGTFTNKQGRQPYTVTHKQRPCMPKEHYRVLGNYSLKCTNYYQHEEDVWFLLYWAKIYWQ